jgi:hypothetical protein
MATPNPKRIGKIDLEWREFECAGCGPCFPTVEGANTTFRICTNVNFKAHFQCPALVDIAEIPDSTPIADAY